MIRRLPRRLTPTRPSTFRERERGLLALLVVIVLAVTLGITVHDSASVVVDEGDTITLSSSLHGGSVHEVRVPTAVIRVQVGPPMDEIAGGLADGATDSSVDPVRPAGGTHLVPVAWDLERTPEVAAPPHGDTTPITLRIVDGENEVELVSESGTELTRDPTPATAVALDEDTDLDDLTVEVEYDGLTQVLSPDTGDIDPGAAAPLYDETRTYDTGCRVDNRCRLEATGARTPWRPNPEEAGVVIGQVAVRPHDAELGWADEGTAWASVDIDVDAPSLVANVDGDHRNAHGARGPTIALDRERPKQISNRANGSRVVFAIDADSSPERLTMEQELTLTGPETPRTVTLRKTIELEEAP